MSALHTQTSFTIRRAVAADYDALVELWMVSGGDLEIQGRESRAAFLKQLEQFPDLYLVATEGGRIVGVVLGTHDGRKGWINRLAVRPDHRRQGIAAALVTACDMAIRGHGIGIVAALVESDNAPSAALFEALGYRADVPVRYFRKTDPLGG